MTRMDVSRPATPTMDVSRPVTPTINDENGSVISSGEDKKARLAEHFKEILN
jgi:hypothetical protein